MNHHPGETRYDVLGVGRGATAEEIRAASRALASQYHPDRHEGNPLSDLAEERLKAINAAYDVLSDPERRAAYDNDLAAGRVGVGPPPRAVTAGARRLVRVAAVVIAAMVAFRLLAPLVGSARAGLGALAGTPAIPIAALAAAVMLLVVIIRMRRAR